LKNAVENNYVRKFWIASRGKMKKEIKYRKLVRDKIPDIIKNSGKEYRIHISEEEEYIKELKNKVIEEMEEFLENPTEEEMGDILEALEGFIDFYGLDKNLIEKVKLEKKNSRGGFKKRIILDKVIENE
jgi:predicted house-cleaning noncanonical NTP pyrophosphatase (MazG superfamily)